MDNPHLPESLPYGLRQKLLTSFFVIIFSLGGLNTYTLLRITGQDRILATRVDQQILLHSIHNDIQNINDNISNYIRSGNDDYLIQYRQGFIKTSEKLNSQKGLVQESREMLYSFRDLNAMLETYRSKASVLIENYQSGKETIYVRESETDLLKLSGYVREELQDLNTLFLDNLQDFFLNFTKLMDRNLKINITAVILIILVCYILAWNFSLSVSRPIHQLALELIRFGRNAEVINLKEPKRKDEITVLFRSFNEMSRRISSQIVGIQEKAELEQKLKDREIQHHKTEHLLKESELSLLQSQMNPHFLFNTLNVIDSLSTLEEAPRTGDMIRSLSELLRYNLLNQKSMVSLEEEVDLIGSYIHIQKTRFGEKLSFDKEIDPEILSVQVPAIILQPLVENAIKHGVEPISRPGKVQLSIKTKDDHIVIEIRDNGVGISRHRIDEIMDTAFQMDSMGIRNVMRRLALKYGKECFQIEEGNPSGTICHIRIPV
ncbi:sensor histidine kinase [Oceanispirochaeta sp.]|jgi:two-component system sensor histidine kinase YesM|uniref:sensor histidine kinase n=1 Tax=Oceanispirochaeta sp. TaxID=2035350 RepID=UPI00261BC15D|nr:histidine kinase [Oceanispirochaeta sp.]MDA3955915.1 histidine kinase [Oceanispirochaeta sp.]